jgi:small basic protein (TIGR04137 family)
MSIDRSLRMKSSLERHRNVLTRAERVMQLQEEDKWGERASALYLPKVSHRKAKASKKKAKEEAATAEGAAATTAAPAAPAK